VIPLVHRAENPARITLRGHELDHEIAGTIADAFARGHDAVLFENDAAPVSGASGRSTIVVKDGAQYRKPEAAFDPAKINSRDLMAGLLPLGLLPLPASIPNAPTGHPDFGDPGRDRLLALLRAFLNGSGEP
jgi:hypothetical protein